MRRVAAIFVVVLAVALTVSAKDPETVDQLKARAAQARPQDQVRLFMDVAKLQVEAADKAYDAGDSEKAKAAIDDVTAYAEKAGDAAISTGKDLKRTEIDVRKLSKRVETIRRAVGFDDRPPLEVAGARLEKLDTRLLDRMFKGKK